MPTYLARLQNREIPTAFWIKMHPPEIPEESYADIELIQAVHKTYFRGIAPGQHLRIRRQICNHVMGEVRIRFGKVLRERRRKLGVSQEAFADLCGLDRTYVGGIERGERNVALVNIEKLARALKISLSELFRRV